MSNRIVSGVYKITNLVTGEFYIGCSTNIKQRWSTHKTRYKEPSCKEYDKKLYQSMREYGIENFKFEILEEVKDISQIFNREMAYINDLSACYNGLNVGQKGERHGRAKLTIYDVIEIRERYAEHESKRSVYFDYMNKISERGFHKIWNGYTWKDVHMDVYTDENKRCHKYDT